MYTNRNRNHCVGAERVERKKEERKFHERTFSLLGGFLFWLGTSGTINKSCEFVLTLWVLSALSRRNNEQQFLLYLQHERNNTMDVFRIVAIQKSLQD
jgi:hypothetical protein